MPETAQVVQFGQITVQRRAQRTSGAALMLAAFAAPPRKERPMTAIIAAVLFGLALLFQLLNISLSVITATVLITAGLLCVALHLAGVGSAVRVRGYTRRR
jgi:hypothetical protein